ncbi:MAG TPA: nucleotidyltransferase domain-containing protein [Thermoanaerobaculia bacterium]|nr:nucleotidyltransferase domain-containing protein [Thermoanaerobaculia bacterium]
MRWREGQPPIDVEAYLPDLRAYLEGLDGLAAAWIHGSYGTPYQTPLSDLDLALVFRPDKVPAFREELGIAADIQQILHEDDASVTVLNRSPVIFQFRVLETGRQLVCNDPVALADFTERVLNEHGDFIVDHEQFLRDYDQAFTERYGRDA